jgi:Asp-tRNA(Asn)/Glu-tRNA(Gln) amidotransferase A subunit family amidase
MTTKHPTRTDREQESHWLAMNQPAQMALHSLNSAQKANDHIQAFTVLQSAERLQQQALAASGLPLQGLPVGIKDIIDTVDFKTEYGTPIHRGFQPRHDAAIVSLLKRAGAVVVGKTVTTEFAFLEPAATLNPHPQLADRTPGGSSSGSAAAVAAGLLPFAVGTQTGGSVIRPASYCGVVGFKPSFGVLPMVGVNVFSWSLDTLGFFAADARLMKHCVSPLHSQFASAVRPNTLLKIGLLQSYPWGEAESAAEQGLAQFTAAAKLSGHTCVEVRLPGSAAVAYEAHAVVQDYEAAHALAWPYDERRDQLSQVLRELLRQAQRVTVDQYQLAQRQIQEAIIDVAKIFERADVIVLPSAPGAPPDRSSTGVSSFNRLWTALGYPCLSLPVWVNDQSQGLRVPIGIQLIAKPGHDADLLRWGQQLEADIKDFS